MNILILGYGFSGYYCARLWLDKGYKVTAISRHYPKTYALDGLIHQASDLANFSLDFMPDIILYCAPPPKINDKDDLITNVLSLLSEKNFNGHFIYWGSSSVYGNHHGAWVDENSECYIDSVISQRRMDAERQVTLFAENSKAKISLLRMSGLFGKERLPKNDNPLIYSNQAPFSNMIFIEDAARLVVKISEYDKGVGKMNVSDGIPKKMGELQKTMALLKNEPFKEMDYQTIYNLSSEMKRYFLNSSKRLSIAKLKSIFADFQFTDFKTAVEKCLLQN